VRESGSSQLITKAEFADFRSNTYTYVAGKLNVSGKRGFLEIYVSGALTSVAGTFV